MKSVEINIENYSIRKIIKTVATILWRRFPPERGRVHSYSSIPSIFSFTSLSHTGALLPCLPPSPLPVSDPSLIPFPHLQIKLWGLRNTVSSPSPGRQHICIYTVSQKTSKIIFVIITSNCHQILAQ